MEFKKVIRTRQINKISDVNKLIKLIDKVGLKPLKIGIGGDFRTEAEAKLKIGERCNLSNYLFIKQSSTKLTITTKWLDGKACSYIFPLNEDDVKERSGLQCFMEMSKYYKMPRIVDNEDFKRYVDNGKFICSAKPILDYNEDYNNNEFSDCYEYDLNSAYASVILKGIPDLWHPSKLDYSNVKVKKGEVGFLLDDDMTMVEEGGIADIKFKIIECPEELKKFIIKWYNIKKEAGEKLKAEKRKTERARLEKVKQQAKDMLNLPVGYTQRYNPFFRAYIIHNCNKVINDLIDDKTLFWNTDAIFTLNKREDIKTGIEIGDFKAVEIKTLRFKGNTYQINDDIPTYRGLPKHWFAEWEKENGKSFNILVDDLPARKNIYSFDMNTLEVKKDGNK